jgi:hypothetical protein
MNQKGITMKKHIIQLLIISCALGISYELVAANNNQQTDSVKITAKSFSCIRDLTKVRGLYIGNLSGNIEETLAVANSNDGGRYPKGSVIQLVPTEVMVKRSKGFNLATNDWEFFELTVSKEGSKIDKRGFSDVVNRFGGNCFSCHVKAEPKWDLVCEANHGCEPLPLTKDMISVIQKTDPRCSSNEPLSENEMKAAAQLRKMMGG